MGELLSYSLSVSVFVLVLFFVLHQIVDRSTDFRFNRVAILCGLVLSLSLPFVYKVGAILFPIDIAVFNNGDIISDSLTLSETQDITDNRTVGRTKSFPWLQTAIVIYLSGVAVLFIREIISFIRLFKMMAQSEKVKTDNHTICLIKENIVSPFCWGNYIFLHDPEFDNPGCIYTHEKAHADKKHWIDLFFADCFCILLWYNPFAWMTRQLMKLNHEFEADYAVIRSGIEPYDYQRLLVVKAMGNRFLTLANSFTAGKRSFRKRILIMNKRHSSRKALLVAICAIPAIALAYAVISMPVSSQILSKISDYSFNRVSSSLPKQSVPTAQGLAAANDVPAIERDTITVIPSPFEDQSALADIIKLAIKTIQPSKETKVNVEIVVAEDGTVKDVITDPTTAADIAAAIQREFNGIRFDQMTDNGRLVEVRFNVPIQLNKPE